MSQFEDYLPNIAKAINHYGRSNPTTILQYFPYSYMLLAEELNKFDNN